MKRLVVALLLMLCAQTGSALAQNRHSIAEYAFLVGNWNCTTHAGAKNVSYTTTYAWMFPEHTAIEQTFKRDGKDLDARFILTYDAQADDFRGIFVDSTQTSTSLGTWINPGMQKGGWTEHGYDLNVNGYPETSTSVFSRVTPTHYLIQDYSSGTGKPQTLTQTEECTKAS